MWIRSLSFFRNIFLYCTLSSSCDAVRQYNTSMMRGGEVNDTDMWCSITLLWTFWQFVRKSIICFQTLVDHGKQNHRWRWGGGTLVYLFHYILGTVLGLERKRWVNKSWYPEGTTRNYLAVELIPSWKVLAYVRILLLLCWNKLRAHFS